ncbi:MAG: ABC transporter transmembrane domain-containing protein [Hyphomicrobiaceae bacterium]
MARERANSNSHHGRGEAAPQRSKRQVDIKPLLSLRAYVLRYPMSLSASGVALLVAAAMMLLIPLAVRRMIDQGFRADAESFIAQYFVMLIVIAAALALASAGRFYFVNWLGERVVADLRKDVFRHLATLGPSYFDSAHSGELMSRLTADTTQIKAAAGVALSQAVRSSIMIIGALIMMFVTSFKLSLLVLVAIPIVIIPIVGFGRLVRRRSRTAQDSLADASAYASENLAAIRTMQAFSSEETTSRRFAGAVEDAFLAARSRLLSRAALTALAMFLVLTSIVLVLWIGASMVIDGALTGGRLGQFVLYAIFVGGSLAQLSEVWGEVQQAAGAAERLTELLQAKPLVCELARPDAMVEPPVGRLEFKHVTFAYAARPETPSLVDVSFAIEPGETVALVGPSGAGKTSLFSLLLRFYDPDRGSITFDGVDIARVRFADLRRRLALVPQEVVVFAGTVADNISYGSEEFTADDIERAARIAHAHDFVEELPNGYATQLGERGVNLSGGQRQRLAIARAVLRDPAVLLLDEATSALDAESERHIQAALEDVKKDRTTLIITHRLTTAQKADRILVIEAGRIVGHGRHDELSEDGGLYQRFAELQLA